MAMSKLLEKGLEAQVLNGLTRDNSKVNVATRVRPMNFIIIWLKFFLSKTPSLSGVADYFPRARECEN